ncbi:MAG: hypothetical protein JOZ78_13570 [Chroococcidiopsidaceae cyanobacterium CP_BM_ER_R8_30]|nr:hypothetical protein [Chroococcidiopsidaceae cyanobacterium CP_BM_ER_R8_30]
MHAAPLGGIGQPNGLHSTFGTLEQPKGLQPARAIFVVRTKVPRLIIVAYTAKLLDNNVFIALTSQGNSQQTLVTQPKNNKQLNRIFHQLYYRDCSRLHAVND